MKKNKPKERYFFRVNKKIFWRSGRKTRKLLMFSEKEFFSRTNQILVSKFPEKVTDQDLLTWKASVLYNYRFPYFRIPEWPNYPVAFPNRAWEFQVFMNSYFLSNFLNEEQQLLYKEGSFLKHEILVDYIFFLQNYLIRTEGRYPNMERLILNAPDILKEYRIYFSIERYKTKFETILENIFNRKFETIVENKIDFETDEIDYISFKKSNTDYIGYFIQVVTDKHIIELSADYLEKRPIEYGSALEK